MKVNYEEERTLPKSSLIPNLVREIREDLQRNRIFSPLLLLNSIRFHSKADDLFLEMKLKKFPQLEKCANEK